MKILTILVVAVLAITSTRAEIVLYGAVQNGNSYLLSLKDTESATSHWMPVGGEIGGYTVVGYDAATGRAKLKKGDMLIESALPESHVTGAPKPIGSTLVGAHSSSHPQNIDVLSSPNGESTDACVAIISAAKDSICIQGLKYMPAEFDRALIAAGKRGVKVEAFLDKVEPLEKNSGARPVAHGNVPIVIVVDEATVITGLLNVFKSIQDQQLEGLLVIRDKNLAQIYLEELTRKKADPKGGSAAR